MIMKHSYLGWFIGYDSYAPVSGRYYASRFGVKMCSNSYESILSMVDTRVKEKSNFVA
jgi:hypothetical protein